MLDQVLQGFLKFSRPEDLRLQPVKVAELVDEVVQVVQPEADKAGVRIETDCAAGVPDINASTIPSPNASSMRVGNKKAFAPASSSAFLLPRTSPTYSARISRHNAVIRMMRL